MVEFRLVKVEGNCDELNKAATDGFGFVEWLPGNASHVALVARDEDAAKARAEKAAGLAAFLEHFTPLLEKLAASSLAPTLTPDWARPPSDPPADDASPRDLRAKKPR